MAKAAPKPKKTVTEANLATLGAERLAGLLIEFATGDAALKRRLRMELSAEVGAGDLALELDKRLVSLAESRAKVSWRKRPGLLTELRAIRRVILERLAPLDTRLALDRLVAWFDLYVPLRTRVSDPKGEMTLMFDEASSDLARLASEAGVDVAGLVLGEALSTRLSEWASWVGRGAGDLSPELARRLLHDLTAGRPRPTGRAALLVRKLADRSGDLDAWLIAVPDDDRTKPEVGAEIARRLAVAGRPEDARAALEAARPMSPSSRTSKETMPEPPPEPWLRAEIAVLLAEGRKADADEARWRLFAMTLSPELVRDIVAGLADFDDVEALDRAFGVAAGHPDVMRGLGFLMNWPALREAAELVLSRRDELRGAVEDVPLWGGRLAARYPEAALLLVRARARALARLGNGMDDELRAVLSEAEGLAVNTDPEPSHAVFAEEIDGLISRKRPVWR